MAKNQVYLRPLKESDLESLVALANNVSISDNLTDAFPSPYTTEDGEKFIELANADEPVKRMAIIWNEQYVGNIAVHPQSDIYAKNAEIGYFIGEPFWGKGIGTEAVRQISKYAFETLGIIRIYATVFEYNKASMRVFEKCGYTFEGIAKKGAVKNGKVIDIYNYALVNEDYS